MLVAFVVIVLRPIAGWIVSRRVCSSVHAYSNFCVLAIARLNIACCAMFYCCVVLCSLHRSSTDNDDAFNLSSFARALYTPTNEPVFVRSLLPLQRIIPVVSSSFLSLSSKISNREVDRFTGLSLSSLVVWLSPVVVFRSRSRSLTDDENSTGRKGEVPGDIAFDTRVVGVAVALGLVAVEVAVLVAFVGSLWCCCWCCRCC